MEMRVNITEMVKECIDKELSDTVANVEKLTVDSYAVNSCLAEKADKSYVAINEQRINNLEQETQPANMLEHMLQDYKQLEAYQAIGTPYRIKERIDTITKERDKYYDERNEWLEKYRALYDEKLDIQSKSVYFEELRNLLCDMMNNYENCTTGLANADTGTARFFYINALSNVMNKIVEMERNKNGYC